MSHMLVQELHSRLWRSGRSPDFLPPPGSPPPGEPQSNAAASGSETEYLSDILPAQFDRRALIWADSLILLKAHTLKLDQAPNNSNQLGSDAQKCDLWLWIVLNLPLPEGHRGSWYSFRGNQKPYPAANKTLSLNHKLGMSVEWWIIWNKWI